MHEAKSRAARDRVKAELGLPSTISATVGIQGT